MREEAHLRQAYNDFRVANSLVAVDFDSLAKENRFATIQLCLICMIKALKPSDIEGKESQLDYGMYKGGIMN
jgi:hypothetical protein